jgi:hypothetical protein
LAVTKAQYAELWLAAKNIDTSIDDLYDEAEEQGSLIDVESDPELLERINQFALVSSSLLTYLNAKVEGTL